MRNKYYMFRRSCGVNVITWMVVALLLVCVLIVFLCGAPIGSSIIIAVLEFAIIAVCILLAPRYMSIENGNIVIRRYLNSITIPLKSVTAIERIEKKVFSNSIRTFGNGGLFAYTGKYYSKQIGGYTVYATDLNCLVLIRTVGRKYVVSCDEANDFIARVNDLSEKK